MQENRANGRIMRSRSNIYILVPICTAILVAIYVSGRPTPADPPTPGGGDETIQQTDQILDEDTNMAATFSEIEANAMACAAGNGRGECISTAWSVLARSDPAAALFWYSRTIEGDEARLQQCHGAHHIIGSSAGETNEIERIMETNPGTCGLGYIHGAIGAYLARQAAGGSLRIDGAAACEQMGADAVLYENCQHALGHEHSRNGDGDVVVACGDGPGGPSCLSGAYMEQIGKISTGAELGTWLRQCPKTPKNGADACLSVLSSNSEAVGLEAIKLGSGLYGEISAACAPAGPKSGICIAGGGVIIHGAGVQGILDFDEIERSFNTELLEMWREAVREAIEETEYLPGGGG